MKHEHNVPLAKLTSFQQAGTVANVVEVESEAELRSFLKTKTPFMLLGRGSNTLINPEAGVETIIKISPNFSEPEVTESRLKVSAGTSVNKLMSLLKTKGLTGLEFSAGVPASVGGMVAMNFGCWGQEISSYIHEVLIMTDDGALKNLSAKDLAFDYRYSLIQDNPWIVLDVSFNLRPDSPTHIDLRIKENVQKRVDKQPLRDKTFGSIFKNPEGHFAAKLIEECGLKGSIFKDIKISEKHANFMVNCGKASYDDMIAVLKQIQDKVKSKTGVDLVLEVQLKP